MQLDLARSLLGLRRRSLGTRGRLPEEDIETHHIEYRRLLDCGSEVVSLVFYLSTLLPRGTETDGETQEKKTITIVNPKVAGTRTARYRAVPPKIDRCPREVLARAPSYRPRTVLARARTAW
ncbi:hypothetical protein BHE74_00051591 [Ensete ventricosum]|nr:hypothetical protein BHE74_00051591 [Ensete ventricosum]